MTYTEPHKSEMIVLLESLIKVNQREINSHMAVVELLLQENEDTIKRIEMIRNDDNCTSPSHELGKCDGTKCVDHSGYCNAPSPNSVYVCTLIKGHSGDHIACSSSDHNLDSWENKNETNPTNDTDDIHG